MLTANSSVKSYRKRIFIVGLTATAYGTQIADFSALEEAGDPETMKTDEFILTYGLGKEMTEILSLIGDFFQHCRYDLTVKYVDEIGKDVLEVKILSKFTPEETAKKEWKLLGEAVKTIPREKTHLVSIFAEIP